ncbi:MAG: Hsp70 family protein [Rhodobacteraceae bacterium]|nr:Hsp70 family protein [Paracoccaceae bacterium]
MPHLGFGDTTGQGRAILPRHYYLDLATWHRINQLYTQRTLADLRALRAMADVPERLDRLLRVISGHHGHRLAMVVEAAKIGLTEAEAMRIALSGLTGGPNPVVTRTQFEGAIAAPLQRIAGTIRAALAMAGVSADRIGTVFMTGGSSRLPAMQALVASLLPGVRVATGDMLGSVGTGLARDAAARFG